MKQPSARAPRWPALLLVLLPGLLAPKGCYFGEGDVPLGGNRDPSLGGQSADGADDPGDADGDGDDTGNATGSDTTGASGSGGAGNTRPGTEMRTPGVFQVH
jgi:hypothetical protein